MDLPQHVKRRSLPGSQILWLLSMSHDPVSLVSPILKGTSQLDYIGEGQFKKDDLVVISDCHHAEVNKIYRHLSGHRQLSVTYPLVYSYYPPIHIGYFVEKLIFIGKNTFKQPSLYISNGKRSEQVSYLIQKIKIQDRKMTSKTYQISIDVKKGRAVNKEIFLVKNQNV